MSKEKFDIKSVINNKKTIIIFVVILLVFILSLTLSKMFIPSIETVKDSVVLVNVYDEDGEIVATGSGFSAYKENWIVTNFHVIEGASSITVLTDNKKEIDVTDIIVFNKKDDLAIIAKEAMKNEKFRKIVCKTDYTIEPTNKVEEPRYFLNTNRLLRKGDYHMPIRCDDQSAGLK